jgi:ankyrin repeat protein
MGLATVVRALVEAGADVNTEKDDGVTPLYIAA